jgi:hypothetical protein
MTEATTTEAPATGNPEVAANKAAFDQRIDDLRNHSDLSDEAKRRYMAEAYEEAMERHNQLIAEETKAEEEKISKLEKEVFAVPAPLAATTGEKIANRQSYRDASFRVLGALENYSGRLGPGAG